MGKPNGILEKSEDPILVETIQKTLELRDFHSEVRGRLDVSHLFDNSFVVLDLDESDLERIVTVLSGGLSVEFDLISDLIFDGEYSGRNIRRRIQSRPAASANADQCWICFHCSVESITERRIGITRLRNAANFGDSMGDIQFVVLVITPIREKETKSSTETARTIGSLFADPLIRMRLAEAKTETDFRLQLRMGAFVAADRRRVASSVAISIDSDSQTKRWIPGGGIVADFRRRWRHYCSDYLDGFRTFRDFQKTISSAVFLYFSIIPTAIALGMLNDANTNGKINVRKELLSQWIGGLWFGVFGGQLFLIMLSTAPISIYIEIIDHIAESNGVDFYRMYTTVGLWCSFFLMISAVTEMSRVFGSLEELFGLFISVALTVKALMAIIGAVGDYVPNCSFFDPLRCERSVGLLFVVLVAGTLWISVSLSGFRSSAFLSHRKRELLSDYALPIGVLLMTVVGIWPFADVPKATFTFDPEVPVLTITPFWSQSLRDHGICAALGFPLAILFFMDQLIVTNTVDNNENKLRKGAAPNWDLLVVAAMNAVLSVLGLPWMHGALPQAFLHLRALADVEDRLVDGTVQSIILQNRETRCATLLAHLFMVPTYFFLLPFLQQVPIAVFHGLFLYLAYASTVGNALCERLCLIFTEQRLYPPTHYIRRVPQRIVHLFTVIELIQLGLLCFIGFAPWPVLELAFPIITFLFIPFRSAVLPCLIDERHLEVLDGVH